MGQRFDTILVFDVIIMTPFYESENVSVSVRIRAITSVGNNLISLSAHYIFVKRFFLTFISLSIGEILIINRKSCVTNCRCGALKVPSSGAMNASPFVCFMHMHMQVPTQAGKRKTVVNMDVNNGGFKTL